MVKMTIELECFFRCQTEFILTKRLLSDHDLIKSSENLQRIANTAMLFGELLCSVKVGGITIKVSDKLCRNVPNIKALKTYERCF